MVQQCSVCLSPLREEIDTALIAGESLRNIAERCSVSVTALHRHKSKGHIPAELTKAQEVKEIIRADTLLEQVKNLTTRATGILDQAEQAGDLRTALMGIREVRGCMDLLARVTGEMNSGPTLNVAICQSPEYATFRTTILEALEPFPEARAHLAQALTLETLP